MRKVIVLFFIFILSCSIQAREWWVNPVCHNLTDTTIGTTNLNGDSCNIVVAFQNASYGDVIYLQQGKYTYGDDYTTSSDNWLTLNDSNIAVIGIGNVILDGNNAKRILFIDYCDSISIENIEFRNGYLYTSGSVIRSGAAIRGLYVGNIKVKNCIFNHCIGDMANAGSGSNLAGGAVYLWSSNGPSLIEFCLFYNNGIKATTSGVSCGGAVQVGYTTIRNCSFYKNFLERYDNSDNSSGVALKFFNSGDIVNCIFYKNYGVAITTYYPENIVTVIDNDGGNDIFLKNNLYYGNYNYSADEVNVGYGIHPLFENPDFIDDNLFYYLQDTSPLLNTGVPYDNTYQNIGCYSKATVYGKAETYAWQDWTDENGDTISEGLSNYFYIDTEDSSLRLSDLYDTGIAISPIIYVGEYPRYFSVDLEVYEKTDLTFGQKQCIDFDETTQEREIQYRTGNTPSEVLSASWQNAVANTDIPITKKYIQIRLKFNKLVEY